VTAYDNAGNYTVYTSPPNRVSTVGPTIDLSNPGDGDWENSASYWTNVTPTPQIDADDTDAPITRIAYSYSNNLDVTCSNGTAVTSGDVLSGVAIGGAVLYVCAVDSAGNVTTTYATYNYETTAPTCTGWSPAEALWSRGDPTVFMPTGCADTGGSGLVNPLDCATGVNDGDTCTVTVRDNAGNEVVLTSPGNRVDDEADDLELLGGNVGGEWFESEPEASILLTPNGGSPVETWRYSWTPWVTNEGGEPICTGGTEIDLTGYDFNDPFIVPGPIPQGENTLYSCTVDVAGNFTFAEQTYNWQIPTPPAPPNVPNTPGTGIAAFIRDHVKTIMVPIFAILLVVVAVVRQLKKRNTKRIMQFRNR
jgi:hypothetical protein